MLNVEKTPESAGKTPEKRRKVSESAEKILSDNEKIILSYIENNISITNKVAREQVGLKETATKNLLNKMCERKLLSAVGKSRGRYYIRYKEY